MKTFVGIDLGSTTTKAVLMDENEMILGRGITNSRSNYETACRVATQEATVDARFTLFRREFDAKAADAAKVTEFLDALERAFRLEQFIEQLDDLEATCIEQVKGDRFEKDADGVKQSLAEVFRRLRIEAVEMYAPGADRKSDFFRDIAGSRYLALAEEVARDAGLPYDLLLNVYDKSIIAVENRPPSGSLSDKFNRAIDRVKERETSNLRKGLGGLGSTATVTPFVGLFGTVLGIINAFGLLKNGGSIDTVGPAIAEALVSTAFGLLIAIPAAMFFNYFTTRVEHIVVDMNDVASEFIDFVLKEGRA